MRVKSLLWHGLWSPSGSRPMKGSRNGGRGLKGSARPPSPVVTSARVESRPSMLARDGRAAKARGRTAREAASPPPNENKKETMCKDPKTKSYLVPLSTGRYESQLLPPFSWRPPLAWHCRELVGAEVAGSQRCANPSLPCMCLPPTPPLPLQPLPRSHAVRRDSTGYAC